MPQDNAAAPVIPCFQVLSVSERRHMTEPARHNLHQNDLLDALPGSVVKLPRGLVKWVDEQLSLALPWLTASA